MTVVALTVQQLSRAGLTPAYAAANAGGNSFPNDGRVFIHVKNGDVADHTVTIDTPQTVDGLAVANLAVIIPDGEERMIGPFPPGIYSQADGTVQITYSAVTDVTIGAFRQ